MEMLDLRELDHQEQEIDEKGLSQVIGGLSVRSVRSVRNLITKQQFGKPFAAVLGVGLVDTLILAPGS
jgi:hypothetical protein